MENNEIFIPELTSKGSNSKPFIVVVQPNGCWIPKNHLASKPKGYRLFKRNGRSNISIHRYAYQILKENIPTGLLVLHNCDNPPCCNPDHLFLGTYLTNATDMHMKSRNRAPRGERATFAKLTSEQVIEIRRLFAEGVNFKEIAQRFNIGNTHVHRLVRRENWKHI